MKRESTAEDFSKFNDVDSPAYEEKAVDFIRSDEGEESIGEMSNVIVPTSLEEMKKEYDKKNKYREQISSKLGEKLLQGKCF